MEKMKPLKKITTLAIGTYFALAPDAKADFGEAIQTAPPGQFQLVGAQFQGNKLDVKGKKKPIKLEKIITKATLKGKTKRWLGTITVPFSDTENSTINQKASGIGDIELEGGPHYKLDNLHLLSTVKVRIPTGDYDPNKVINEGTGQYAITPFVRATKLYKQGTFDLGIGYEHNFGELSDKMIVRTTPGLKFGNWQIGIENIYTDNFKGKQQYRAGPCLRYTKKNNNKPSWHITGFVEKDWYNKNGPQGVIGGIRVRKQF
jgi:hypothetical protein|tara:strand:- start:2023 stop:2802 length:780 start_codon:yes stop_codon:yes gene_type:complete